jgi:peptidoglycan hydrolase CwlO-like protein
MGGNLVLNKKLSVIALALGIMLTANVTVFADNLTDNLNSAQKQLQQNKQLLDASNKKSASAESQMESLDNQIQNTMLSISATNKKIDITQADIKSAQIDLQVAEDAMKAEKDIFDKRMRAMYIAGNASYLEIILDSKNLDDLFSKVEDIQKIMDSDKKIIADLKTKQDVINTKTNALNVINKNLVLLKADNVKKLSTLNESKAKQVALAAQFKAEQAKYSSNMKASQAQIDKAKKQIQAIRAAAPKLTASRVMASRGSTPYSSNNIVAYASNFLGTPYVWGANGPSTFDCSGFVRYVFNHFGISFDQGGVRRTTYDMVNVGTPVPKDQIQPGDVLYFGPDSDIHHIAIYVGNGCYIHAPQTGDVVKISALSGRDDFNCARRMN